MYRLRVFQSRPSRKTFAKAPKRCKFRGRNGKGKSVSVFRLSQATADVEEVVAESSLLRSNSTVPCALEEVEPPRARSYFVSTFMTKA